MKNNIFSWVKIAVLTIVFGSISLSLQAVPAYRGWQTRTQPDGSTIEIRLCGDEFFHYALNRDGKQVRENAEGYWEVVGEAPTEEVVKARRAASVIHRQRQEVGTEPNLAPKGVVILANFKDSKMASGHTQAVFDEMCNSTNCTVNAYNGVKYGSAAQYFADQSNGSYRPQFDVFGPVTLSNNYAYYGKDKSEEGDDQYATTAVVEACLLANQNYDIDFTQYDSDNDGYVDFVYVIYAGKGQADGGDANTIWPHNWSVQSAIQYGYCTYTKSQARVDGKYLDNYACSAELSGSSLSGIGTLCHEFGHVMGLPDLYDIEYGTVYKNSVTPNDWNIMDGGSYNADGHCPPNYDPWQKDFFGWLKPINLGNNGQNVELLANGTEGYQTYQINASGSYVSPTTSGLRYYIENRQAKGWDAPLTGHGMLIWKVNFNSSAWTNNAPNGSKTSGAPLYTIVSATGTKVGWDGSNDNCPKNTFPGSGKVTSYNGISNKPLTDITESAGVITLKYMGGAAGHAIVTNATGCTITPSALTVENGVGFTATITPKSDQYAFSSLSVTLGSTTLTEGTHYTLSNDKKTLSVLASAVTGDAKNAITITAVWQKAQCSYDILQDPEGCIISSESGTVATNTTLHLTITPKSGYSVADAACWEVEMGTQKLVFGKGFTYNSETGAFTIEKVIDDVAIYLYPGYVITWQALGVEFATTVAAGGKILLPEETPIDCPSGKEFVGWYNQPYEDEAVAPVFTKDGDKVTAPATFYAVYAEVVDRGEAEVASVTFKTASQDGTQDVSSQIFSKLVDNATGISSYRGNKLYPGKKGVKLGSGSSNGWIELTLTAAAEITSVKVEAYKYGSDTGELEAEVDDTSLGTQAPDDDMTFTAESSINGTTVTIGTTSKRAYVKAISILAGTPRMSGYTTSCTAPEKHKISLSATEHGSIAVVPTDSAYYGAQVTVTTTPAEGYVFASLTVKDATDNEVTVTGEGNTRYFRMPDSDVTVAATFAPIPTYTIRFFSMGSLISTQTLKKGETAEKPADPSADCEDYTFAGWWTEELAADNKEAKTWVTSFIVSDDQDFFAVFSKTEQSESGEQAFDGQTGGNYKIFALVNGVKYYASILTSGKLESSTDESAAAEFVFEKVTDGFAIKLDGSYLKYTSGTNLGVQDAAYTWEVSEGTAGSWRVTAGSNSSRAIAFSTSGNRFGGYSTGNIGKTVNGADYYDIEIGSAGPVSTTYYTTTVECSQTGVETVVREETAKKVLRDGQILIIRGDRTYTIAGQIVE